MIDLDIDFDDAFKWSKNSMVFAKGYAYTDKEVFLDSIAIVSFFEDVHSFEDFYARTGKLNGLFSIIYTNSKNNETYLAVDRMRMFPLFYTFYNNDYYISDNIQHITERTSSIINIEAIKQFLAVGFTPSSNSLYYNIHQVVAGSVVYLKPHQEIKIRFYHRYTNDCTDNTTFTSACNKLQTVFQGVFNRLINSLGGRTAVVPLSGGFDSRLIVAMFYKAGYRKVICYTYGRSGNEENTIAEQVAKKFGYIHIFIDYKAQLWKGYINDPTFNQYFDYTTKGVSMLFLQEYFATKYLKDNQLIPSDSIFIPGHLGDFIGGSQLTKHNINTGISVDKIMKKIYSSYFIYASVIRLKWRDSKAVIEATCDKAPDLLPESIFEDWVLKERSKAITNSANVYNFFGYQHRLPFWDHEFIDFFRTVPIIFKKNKKLYKHTLFEGIFKPLLVNFQTELQPSVLETKLNYLKVFIKKLLPGFLKEILLKESIFTRLLSMGEMAEEMIKEMKDNNYPLLPYYHDYNFVVIQWCIFRYLNKTKNN